MGKVVWSALFTREYERALEVIIDKGDQYPELVRMMTYRCICLKAMLGEKAEALRLLEEALAAGIYFPAMVLGLEGTGDPGNPLTLAALDGLPAFERLKATHQTRYWGSDGASDTGSGHG